MDVTIVIPVFNQVDYTRKCLDSLREAGFPESRTIVIDNASTDETTQCLAARPKLQVVRNEINRFCGAWAQGAKLAAPAEWTVILNNDVLIPKGWVEGLIGFGAEEGFSVVGTAMCEGESDYDFETHAREFMVRMANVRRPGIANGAGFVVHRRVFDSIGIFAEDPRLGGLEDDEFFRRCRKNGVRLAMTGRAFMHHYGSVTQKAVKNEMKRPKSSLADRNYYRKKYGLNWFKRRKDRFGGQLMSLKWRLTERMRYGCTLKSFRMNGQFVWR